MKRISAQRLLFIVQGLVSKSINALDHLLVLVTLWNLCNRLYLLIKLLGDNLLAFKQARETQDYSGGSNTTFNCGVRGEQ